MGDLAEQESFRWPKNHSAIPYISQESALDVVVRPVKHHSSKGLLSDVARISASAHADKSLPSDCAPVLSVVVPFFNEKHRLEETLSRIVGLANSAVEVVLVDDGSTDGTSAVLREAASGVTNVRFHQLARNSGKGAAVRAGIALTTGASVAFMDADLATDLACLPHLLEALEKADIAIGSRSAAAAELHQLSRARSFMGGLFNKAVRKVTGLEYADTQCGFKAFRGEVARRLFALNQIDGFAFDVEVLLFAQVAGMRIVEVPVKWTERDGSKVRVGIDPLKMLWDLLQIRWWTVRHSDMIIRDLGSSWHLQPDFSTSLSGQSSAALPA